MRLFGCSVCLNFEINKIKDFSSQTILYILLKHINNLNEF
jgi:hypothetical protein